MTSPGTLASSATGYLCLLNGGAGSGTAQVLRDELARIFGELGQNTEIVMAADCDEMAERARLAAARGDRLVIAGGGDGTISTVANALAGTDTALAILPLGTLNHFAKDLGIPLEVEAAAANVFSGYARSVDVGEVNDRVFVNNSSIGIYPAIVRERESLQQKGHRKWIAFAQALVAILRRLKTLRVRLVSAECKRATKVELVFIGNNSYDVALPRIGGRARLDEGILWVSYVPRTGRFRAFLSAARALFATPKSQSPLAFTTREIVIKVRRKRIDVALDGEVVAMKSPLRYRSRPASLRVIVPAENG